MRSTIQPRYDEELINATKPLQLSYWINNFNNNEKFYIP